MGLQEIEAFLAVLANQRREAAATHLLRSSTDIRAMLASGTFGCEHDDDLTHVLKVAARGTSSSLDALALRLQSG